MNNSIIKQSKINNFTFWYSFSFILNGYASGIPGLSLGSIVLIFYVVYTLFNYKLATSNVEIMTYLSYFIWIIISIIGYLNSDISSSSLFIIGNCKLLIWLLMITIVSNKYFNLNLMTKWFLRFSIIMTIYLAIQTVAFYVFGTYLPNIISFGPLQPYEEGYANYELLKAGNILRPAAFLSESSFYGNFVLCSLAMYLEKNHKAFTQNNLKKALFLSLGIILSTSTSAIILLIFIWILYISKVGIRIKLISKNIFFLVLLAVALFLVTLDSISLNRFIDAIQYAFNKFEYLDTSSRFGKSYGYLNYLDDFQKCFGVGIGNDSYFIMAKSGLVQVYTNSITSIITQIGYIGLLSYITLIIYIFYRIFATRNTLCFVLLVIYFVKLFMSGIAFSTYGILYMFIILGYLNRKVATNSE